MPGWAWMIFGLSLGLVVALGVYLTGPRAPGTLDLAPATEPAAAPAATASTKPAPRTAAEPAESRFEFYEILPEFEVVIPERQRAPLRRDGVQRTATEPGRYILQAGSFSSLEDADRLQASLALLGIESRIQRVTIDADVYHRVRIGPIDDVDELNRILRQLAAADIEPLLMKAPQ
jgi:cell division protein FtsN